MSVVTLSFEVEHRIHDVLESLRTGQVSVFRDVPDEKDRCAGGFGEVEKLGRHLPDLADASRRGRKSGGVYGLHRIEDDQYWVERLELDDQTFEMYFAVEKERRGHELPAARRVA